MNAEMIFNEFAKYAESDDKYYARIKALKIINEALEERLENV